MELKRVFVCCMFIFCFLITSCSYKTVQIPQLASDLDAQQNKVEQKGFVLMARPIHLQSEHQNYFERDLLEFGILPVQIYIYNKSYGKPVMLKTSDINLINPKGLSSEKKSMDQLAAVVSLEKGMLLGPIGGLAAKSKIKDAYEPSLIKEGNIIPGAIAEGLTYFSIPKDIANLNGWKISIILLDPSDSSKLVVDYGLSGTIDPRRKIDQSSPQNIPK